MINLSDFVYSYNDKSIGNGDIVYLISRNLRVENNLALDFALEKAKELNKKLKIIYKRKEYESPIKKEFITQQLEEVHQNFINHKFDFVYYKENENIKNLPIGLLVIDFNPIKDNTLLKEFPYKIYEVDSTNIIPARIISQKQEYSAFHFRKKVHDMINGYLYEPQKITNKYAKIQLDDFIQNKLPYYSEFRNDTKKDVISGLSKFLNLGFISSRQVVSEILKSNVDEKNKQEFIEEIIVRKELAENFCLYNPNYKSFLGLPNWGQKTLNNHRADFRQYIYTKEEFEFSKTHSELWNKLQIQLRENGIIHSYSRMFWAKKILEWTRTPEDAIDIATYLNDKYAFDAPSVNGYVGILWSIGGLHDRPFRDYPVTGQIRRMNGKKIT